MVDALSLLFELDADGRPAVAEFQRVRKAFAAEIAALRKSVVQSFTLPPIKLPTAQTGSGKGQADAHVKEFRRLEAEAAKSARAQEREERRKNAVIASLDRQRSAEFLAQRRLEDRAAIASARGQERAAQQASRSIANAFRGIGPGLQSIGRTLTVGVTAPLLALGVGALKSAKDLDANVNTLKAFTGSAEAAERRLAQLIKTSRATPGLTTNLALTLDAQLRTAKVMEETIDRVLPAIGRLNAVSKLPDAGRFTQNLLQLVTQNFEKQDLKELVGQSPIAGQLITEVFNVDSPTNAKAIRESAKKLGLTSVDAFIAAFAAAAQKNQGLANVTESIGTRFDKLVGRVQVALRPLGLAIINAIEPFVEPIAKLIERIGNAFNSLSEPVKTAIVVIAGIAAAAGPVLFVLGSLATGITSIVTAIGAIGSVVAAVGLPAIAAAVGGIVIIIGEWVAILAALGLAWKTNFLNIRELVTDAASVIAESFGRIKAILSEVTERVLPTLQSITTKVLGIVALAWEKYGKDVIAVVGVAFSFATRVVEEFLRTFGDVVDLLLKLIDGDFRGAWNAFSRIIVNALKNWQDFLQALGREAVRAFARLAAFIISQAVAFVRAGHDLSERFIAALAIEIVKGFPTVRDALTEMFIKAANGFQPGTAVAIMLAKFIGEIKKGAAVRVPVSLEAVPQDNLQRIELNPDGTLKKKPTTAAAATTDGSGKGADAETKRRIRLLELEADRAEAIAKQRIAAENIAFEQRRTSLKDFTEFQIREEEIVLERQKKVFAAERTEAEKLGKGRELALGEIRLKELKADLDFADKKNQLLANQQRQELEAAKAHRQAILDLNEQADTAELARLEDLTKRSDLTAFDVEKRRAEIQAAAFQRRRTELAKQLGEAGENKEEQGRILDELTKLNKQHAADVEESERRIRDALDATVEKYRQYRNFITGIILQTREVLRGIAQISLADLGRTLGNEQTIIERRRRLALQEAADRHRENKLQIDDLQKSAEDEARAIGRFEARKAEIEKRFNQLRAAETRRAAAERRQIEADAQRDLERANPASGRSVFGDLFADTTSATGSALQGLLATGQDVFSQLSAQAGNMRDIMVSAFSAIGQAVGDAVQAFVLYGNAGTSVRKFAAQVIAGVAAMAAVKAVFEVAEGLAALARAFFGDPKAGAEAALHFKSAATYGIVAGIAAAAGRAISGGAFSNNQGTASSAVNGGEPSPRNREFQNSAGAESSSTSTREGSAAARTSVGGVVRSLVEEVKLARLENAALTAKLDGTLSRINSLRPGDVVTIGAPDARQAIAVAVIDHSNADGDFNEKLQRNLGFA